MADKSDKGDKGVKDVFRQVYDLWEKSAGEQVEKIARSQTFLSALAQNLEQTLSFRMKEASQTTLKAMNLATSQDIEALNKQLKAIRNALDEINEKLDILLPKPPEPEPEPEPEPPKTKAKPRATRTRKTTK
jgi:seryl-tRNA synthetase